MCELRYQVWHLKIRMLQSTSHWWRTILFVKPRRRIESHCSLDLLAALGFAAVSITVLGMLPTASLIWSFSKESILRSKGSLRRIYSVSQSSRASSLHLSYTEIWFTPVRLVPRTEGYLICLTISLKYLEVPWSLWKLLNQSISPIFPPTVLPKVAIEQTSFLAHFTRCGYSEGSWKLHAGPRTQGPWNSFVVPASLWYWDPLLCSVPEQTPSSIISKALKAPRTVKKNEVKFT